MHDDTVRRRAIWRLAMGIAALAFGTACGSQGCDGCATQEIPGGFPAGEIMPNAMQIRLSEPGINYLENNFDAIVAQALPGGTTFDIPPSDCGGSQQVCCKGNTCSASFNLGAVQITPQEPSRLHVDMDATVKTTDIDVKMDVTIGTVDCKVDYDSARDNPSTLTLGADIDFTVDPLDDNKLQIVRGGTSLSDFTCSDIRIRGDGNWVDDVGCTLADWLCGLFKGTIEDQLKQALDDTLDQILAELPKGQEGRADIDLLADYTAGSSSTLLDYIIWGGSYTQSENNGLSVGGLGGFVAPNPSACVPDCEAPNPTCQRPAKASIQRSNVFRGNKRPDGNDFHVGIGVHRSAIEQAAYGLFRGGAICLDLDSYAVPQLKSELFALIIPSLNTLTNKKSVPLRIEVRPRKPPHVRLGSGAFHTEGDGTVVIDDPLVIVEMEQFTADIFALIDERYIRLLRMTGNLSLPLLLFADADGKLQPVLGDLGEALADVRVEHSELLAETPEKLAQLFPTLIGLAAGALGGGFDPIELPEVQGIKILLDRGSITSVENNQVLAIFGNLSTVQQTSAPFSFETEVDVESLTLPETDLFSVARRDPTTEPPKVVLRLGTRGPVDGPVQWSYRVDGGFWRPWQSSPRAVVSDPVFWVQGRHKIEVIARSAGLSQTTDPTPAEVTVEIDTVAPELELVPTAGGLRAEVHDAVSPPERIELSWSLDGQVFTPYAQARDFEIAPGTRVFVRARDAVGNVAERVVVSQTPSPPALGQDDDDRVAGGCAVGSAPRSALLPLLVLIVALARRRRRA